MADSVEQPAAGAGATRGAADLRDQKCVACQVGAPAVTDEELAAYRPQIADWILFEEEGIRKLRRTFTFRNFAEALAFTNRVAELAEAEGHHPRLITEWGRVTVDWWTHKIRDLHRNDLIMAAKTDELYA
ncbi:MAG TPA: 4a-hydroxytetrahydrobiopterin dehydratase [Bacillota bacterium]